MMPWPDMKKIMTIRANFRWELSVISDRLSANVLKSFKLADYSGVTAFLSSGSKGP